MRLKSIKFIIVYIPALLIDYAFGSILTNTSFYSSSLKFSSTFLGVLMAIATGFYTFLAVPLGNLSDKVDRHRMLFIGCLLIGVISFLLPFCNNKLHLLLIFPGIGFSMALFWPSYEAWLAEREGESKLLHRVMLFNLFWCSGITLGPATSGYLFQDTAPFTPFYLAGTVGFLTILLLYFFRRPTIQTVDEKTRTGQTIYPSAEMRRNHLNIARCANFASWFSLAIFRNLSPKLTKEMGILPKTFGNLILTLGTVQILTFLFLGTGYSTRWHYRVGPLMIFQGIAVISFLVIWKLQETLFWYIAYALIGISVAYTYFCSLYYGLDRHEDKGNKSGWHEAALGLGSLLGPFLGGIIADTKLGPQSPYLLCAIVITLSICIELIITVKNRPLTDVL